MWRGIGDSCLFNRFVQEAARLRSRFRIGVPRTLQNRERKDYFCVSRCGTENFLSKPGASVKPSSNQAIA